MKREEQRIELDRRRKREGRCRKLGNWREKIISRVVHKRCAGVVHNDTLTTQKF